MAFVLIQHLAPTHESALAAILSKATKMPVREADDGLGVEANQVYIIPPNTTMTLRGDQLRLAPRSPIAGLQHPIDDFCLGLADERGARAIGVLLSGMGSDGTLGLKAIRAAGGITFVQEPKSAQWPAMPQSAITAGVADFVLTPKRIAGELARIGKDPYLAENAADETGGGNDLEKICLALLSTANIDFRLYKEPTFRRRVARRMALLQIPSLEQYAQVLKEDKDEARALADDIFIHVTGFFRDPECFQALRKRVIAQWRNKKATGGAIRVWVPGCSTGEEVYSLAMLVLEELGDYAQHIKLQFFGTDIQEGPTAVARAGIYPAAALAGVSAAARLKRFFVKVDQGYQIQPFVRELCIFACHDLAKDPPFSRVDLISCRNVLIYMGAALQKRVLSTFQYALKPQGFLFLGNSESISGFTSSFSASDRNHRIFARLGPSAFRETPETPVAAPLASGSMPFAQPEAPVVVVELRKEVERVLLEHYMPPALIVDASLQIVYFQGDTSPYLSPATGEPSFHLLKMVHPAFVVDLRTTIATARKSGGAAHKDGVAFTWKGRGATVRLEVRPLPKTGSAKKPHLMIVFQNLEAAEVEITARKPAPPRIDNAERELASLRQQLRLVISEHETAQEEMKAASEEILSANEELQSTNEELETAKEELESSNEELITLNEELQHRNIDLGILSTDLNGLLVNLDMPVLVLDNDLRVRRFTPAAAQLMNLIPGDVGRPFSNLASNLEGANWSGLLADVAATRQPVERDVTDRNGHRYLLRMRPHKTAGNELSGVVVFLIDVEALHRALDAARQEQERTAAILNSLPALVAVIGTDGTITATNQVWDQRGHDNGANDGEVGRGANYLDVCRRALALGDPSSNAALEGVLDVLAQRRESFQLEYPCTEKRRQRWFLMRVTPLKGGTGGAVIVHLDVTDRKLAELAVAKSEATVRALLEASPQAVIAVGIDGLIKFTNGNTEGMFGYSSAELIGQPLSFLVPKDARQRHAGHQEEFFQNMGNRRMGLDRNLKRLRKDGSTFPVEVDLSGVDTVAGKMAVAFISDVTQRKHLEALTKTYAAEVQALAAGLLRAQEEERERISRELHDEICQQLAALALDVARLTMTPVPLEQIQKRLQDIRVRAITVMEEARHLAHDLHPLALDDEDLLNAIRELCAKTEQEHGLQVDFKGNSKGPVPSEIASCVFRVAQESLANAVQHAETDKVSVTFAIKAGKLMLRIRDNGVGFDPAVVRGRGGLGLVSMAERARLVRGELAIESQPGKGTVTTLRIGLPPA